MKVKSLEMIFTPSFLKTFITIFAALFLFSCGNSSDPIKPPPLKESEGGDKAYSLEVGNYYVERLWNLADGCKRNPLDPTDPITATNYALTNDGNGKITLEMCIYENTSLNGYIGDNKGTLSVYHNPRVQEVNNTKAQFTQNCNADIRVTANNTMEIAFRERQTSRNNTMKKVSEVKDSECTTSYSILMKKR